VRRRAATRRRRSTPAGRFSCIVLPCMYVCMYAGQPRAGGAPSVLLDIYTARTRTHGRVCPEK
jgi:hypothetical protein